MRLSMFRHTRFGFYFYSAASTSSRNSWDPTVSLSLKHPTLVLLERCRTSEHFKQILAQMMRLHLTTQTFPMSRLLHFSAISHSENLNEAILLFSHFTPHRNLYIYNMMISALSFLPSQSMNLYKSMLWSCIYPDEHTLLSLLKSSKSVSEGKQIHAHVIINGFSSHVYLQNSLIKMYLENGRMAVAKQVLKHMPKQDTISFNIIISGYAKKGYSSEALESFHNMAVSGIEPDQYTIVGLLMCCAQLKNALLGKSIHGWIIRKMSASGWDLILSNALLDMYAKCVEMETALRVFHEVDKKDAISWNIVIAGIAKIGELDLARRFFDEMPCKDLVSWNSLLAGYAWKGDCRTVMELLEDMLACNVRPDKVTAMTLVCAAAEMGALNQGRSIHGWVVKAHGKLDAFLGSALIDMYCKCGSIERSLVVFEMISERDITVWTAMIMGLAFHGHGNQALKLFGEMQEEGIMPNDVTLIAILTACSHTGLVDQGCRIFEAMKRTYGIEPGVEHYGCLVDVLGRAGRLTEATNLIRKMPMKPSRSIWGAMLNACKAHENVELAKFALKELLKLEPEEEGGYILLSNVYAACRQWGYSEKIREIMDSRGVKKMAGCSNVVVDGVVHEFVSSDKRHPRWGEICCMLSILNREMRSGAEISLAFLQQLLGLYVD